MTLDETIEFLIPRAYSEQALEGIGAEINPWAGSTERLAQVESERVDELRRSRGESVLTALATYAKLNTEHIASGAEVSKVKLELDTGEKDVSVIRWQEARVAANTWGIGHRWVLYSQWFESNRTRPQMTALEAPSSDWPELLQFDDTDREIIGHWRELQRRYELALQMQSAAEARLWDFLREHPEMERIDPSAAAAQSATCLR
ncbi:MAG: hypothetical protein WB615_14915 [Candidatus Tumulicola sp.]